MTLREKLRRLYRRILSKLDIQNRFCKFNYFGINGPCEEYRHGHLWRVSAYAADLPIGTWREYHENGQLAAEYTYDDHKIEGPYKRYHENGQLKSIHIYHEGDYEGPYVEYYENGQLRRKGTYKRDKQEGLFETYHENGQLECLSFYKDGCLDGPMEEYDENGQLIKKSVYERDLEQHGLGAEEYLREWQAKHPTIIFGKEAVLAKEKEAQRQQTIKGLKEQLEKATDAKEINKVVGPARTPERKAYAERIVKTRRARGILSIAAQKAYKEGNEELLNEITEIAKPYAGRYAAMVDKARWKRVQRRAKSAGD